MEANDQLDRLARWFQENAPEEIGEGGAVDVAIATLEKWKPTKAERVTAEDLATIPDLYKSELYKAHMLAAVLGPIPLAEMISAAERCHTTGPFLDPTLYRDKMQALDEDLELLRALRGAQVRIEKLKKESADRFIARLNRRPG